MKQEVAKFTLMLSIVPQFVCTLVAMLLDINPVYILVLIILYSLFLYWLIETRFNLLLTTVDTIRTYFSQR